MLPRLCYFRCCQGCAFLPETGLCGRGSVVPPLPSGEKRRKLFRELPVVQGCGDGGARSVPGIAGLRWRGRGSGPWGSRGLSSLVLGRASLPAPSHRCQADASGLCPCAVPGANNAWEEAACCWQRLCPEPPPRSDALPARAERVLPLPPAPTRRHMPGAAAASSRCLCACCRHSPAACRLSRCPPLHPRQPRSGSALPAASLGGDANTSIISASTPNGVSSVTFIYFSS